MEPQEQQMEGRLTKDTGTKSLLTPALTVHTKKEYNERVQQLKRNKHFLIDNKNRRVKKGNQNQRRTSMKKQQQRGSSGEVGDDDDDDSELITHQGEVMRCRLIDEFQLLSSVDKYGNTEAPRIQTSELQEDELRKDLLGMSGRSLVKFVVYGDATHDKPILDKHFNRIAIRASKYPSCSLFCGWFVRSTTFQTTILILILINVFCVGWQTEFQLTAVYRQETGDWKYNIQIFECINITCLVFFTFEIIVKMRYDLQLFWHNGWDVFDFVVTVVSIIPEIVDLIGTVEIPRGKHVERMNCDADKAFKDTGICYNQPWYETFLIFLRLFRVFRILKAIARFRQIRLVVLALFKTLKTLFSILILLLIFWFMFSVAAVLFFREELSHTRYCRMPRPTQSNPHPTNIAGIDCEPLNWMFMFQSWHISCLTLFVIFTNDHWYEMIKDLMVVSPVMGPIFIILWSLIGSYIFQNIVLGFLNNNFSEIRETIGKNLNEMERMENLTMAVNELKKMGKEDMKTTKEGSVASSERGSDIKAPKIVQSSRSDTAAHQRINYNRPYFNNNNNDNDNNETKDNDNYKDNTSGDANNNENNNDNFNDNNYDDEDIDNHNQRRETSSRLPTNRNTGLSAHRAGRHRQPIGSIGRPVSLIERQMQANLDYSRRSQYAMRTDSLQSRLNLDKNIGWVGAANKSQGDGGNLEMDERERDWEKFVVTSLTELEDTTPETVWPRDTLFDYYRLMETMQENLAERAYLLQLMKMFMIALADRQVDKMDRYKPLDIPEKDELELEAYASVINRDHFNKQISYIAGDQEGCYIRQMIKLMMTEEKL